jgi:energy-coupling factor transporter ATP-binding protein EcfA2
MNTFVYVFGQPGSGKTTLMRAVCNGSKHAYEATTPVKHRGYASDKGLFAVLGGDAFPFAGTDTLSYTTVKTASEWLEELSRCKAGSLVFAEGDRLANQIFFEKARKHYRLLTFYLCCSNHLAEIRRSQRAEKHGLKKQSAPWVKGRITKAKNLAATCDPLTLDATRPPEVLAAEMWRRINDQARPTTDAK